MKYLNFPKIGQILKALHYYEILRDFLMSKEDIIPDEKYIFKMILWIDIKMKR